MGCCHRSPVKVHNEYQQGDLRPQTLRTPLRQATQTSAMRRVKRNERDIINEGFADAMFVDNTRDFWSDVKRLRSNKTLSK